MFVWTIGASWMDALMDLISDRIPERQFKRLKERGRDGKWYIIWT